MLKPFKVIDLSLEIRSLSTPMFPGYPQPLKTMYTTIETAGYNSNVWIFVEHTATHVDAPLHFIKNGLSIDKLPIETFIGWATVLDFSWKPPRSLITRQELEDYIQKLRTKGIEISKDWIILIHTGYGTKAGTPQWYDYPGLSEDACMYLLELGVKAIGTDAPSPDREPFPAHTILLPKGVAIYENLTNLDKLIEKKFLFVGLPLKLVGGTGSPVRAVAIIFEE